MLKRNHTVDCIKGIAILFVTITHYSWNHQQLHNPVFPYLIDMAVPVFMIISGYVYSSSYERKNIKTFHEAYKSWNIIDKIMRYTIPFTIIVIYQLIDSNVVLDFKSCLDFIRWIIVGTIGQGSYYYPVMIQFIFVFPVIFFMIKKYKFNGLRICFVATLILEILTWAYNMNDDCYRLLIIRYLFAIAIGVYAHENDLSIRTSLVMTIIGGVYIAMVTYVYMPVLFHGWQGTSLFATLYIAPIIIYIIKNTDFKAAPLELMGKASFHIYLVQMCYYLSYRVKLSEIVSTWQLCFLIGIIISISLGVVFYFIESRISKFALNLVYKRFDS